VTSSGALADLEPALVWTRFLELTRIPRPPKEEARAREHVLDWAEGLGLETDVDGEGNVVVRVPASAGRERAPTMVLQSHLDMVCERDPVSPIDPRTDPLDVVLDGDWVAAAGTTLGADNGIGVAAAMAIGEDAGVEHGPLELLFTVSEEQGLEGAKALAPGLIAGRLLVNLDGGDEEASITVGCAGSIHTFLRLALDPEPLARGSIALTVSLGGARGGHSGADIAAGRINAVKALGRVLSRAGAAVPLRLASFEGGVSRNAIPRDARAVVSLAATADATFRDEAESELTALRQQFAGTDDGLTLAIAAAEAGAAADEAASARALDLLAILPSGVIAMTPSLPGAVETSSSVTVAETSDGVLSIGSMTRSASARALDDVEATIAAAARLAGAEIEVRRSYPPWEPDPTAPLLTAARRTHERVFGAEPALKVVHGGLECAVIGERIPDMEMISIGPDIRGPHAPGERLGVASTERFYRFLGALVDDLSSGARA
jgi:dipeptidase D